jgi:uncharacterized protein (TIGR02271 family)
MQGQWYPVVDAEGRRGRFATSAADPSRIEVELDSGERLLMPRALIVDGPDGSHRFEHAFSALLDVSPGSALILPVIAEEVIVEKRTVPRERVRIHTKVSTRDQVVDVAVTNETLNVERVPVGQVVESKRAPWQDGDTFIVPVYEETFVIEKRLVLREEVRVTCTRRQEHVPQHVQLRTEEVSIERGGAPLAQS